MTWNLFRRKRSIIDMSRSLPRADILRRGRIALLDDERPEMLDDLRNSGLSIDHFTSTDDNRFSKLSEAFYDLLLLDYGGIGARYGGDEGLDVLRFLKRVYPSLRIVAFTARTFDSSKADFFRLCDGVIKKDSGIRETMEIIEQHLSTVLTAQYQFDGLVRTLDLDAAQRAELERAVLSDISRGHGTQSTQSMVKKLAKSGTEKVVDALIAKLIELGASGAFPPT